jgi:integrase/recombinase XerD
VKRLAHARHVNFKSIASARLQARVGSAASLIGAVFAGETRRADPQTPDPSATPFSGNLLLITDFININSRYEITSRQAASRHDCPRPRCSRSDGRRVHRLADVPSEAEWFGNLSNPHTRGAYENALRDFMRFAGIVRPREFRIVTRAHIIAWRDELAQRGLGGSTIRHRLASLASLFEYLCDKNAVTHNPVKGVKRPNTESGEGKTPAIADRQARKLLEAPRGDSIRGKRDRAILSTLLFHALRREELCKLKVKDFRHARKGVPHLKVWGMGGKTRYLPLHTATKALIDDYLGTAGHGADDAGALFRPLRNNRTGRLDKAITPDGIYKLVRAYSAELGFEIGAHALRATAATNALDHHADIAKVQEWLGHASMATTQIYDRRRTRPEDSPTFKVAY